MSTPTLLPDSSKPISPWSARGIYDVVVSILRSRAVAMIATGTDWMLGILVVGQIGFCTALFGIVKPGTEFWALLLGGAIAGLLAFRLLLAGPARVFPRSAAYGPILIFLLVVIAQLLPLPRALLGILSPRTLEDKANLLSDLPDSALRLRYVPLSYYTLGTLHMLRVVLLDVVVFLTILAIARTPRRIVAILIGLSVLGAALMVLAVAQDWSHAQNIYWMNGLDTQAYAGPFVSHSDFAQQMNQFIGVVLALILLIAAGDWPKQLSGRLWRTAALVLAAAVVIGGIIAILLAKSRGGTVYAILGATFVILVLASRRGLRTLISLVVVLACLTVGAALLTGFDSIFQHLATLKKAQEYSLRIHNASDILGISRRYSLFGTGLGTHQYFFPRFESANSTGLSTHAENEYAQMLEETGLIGLACVVAFAVIVWIAAKRAITSGHPMGISAIGLGYGLVAVQAQSFSDFGQHLPALGCLSAIVCALMIRLGRLGSPAAPAPKARGSVVMFGQAALAVLLVLGFAWALKSANISRLAEEQYQLASALEDAMEEQPWYRTPRQNRKLIREIQSAVDLEPNDIAYHLWLGVWREKAIVTPRGSGNPEVPTMTGASEESSTGASPADIEAYEQIVADLNEARYSCPTFGPLYTFVGQLELHPLNDPIGARHIRLGALLAPHDDVSLYEEAAMEAEGGLWDSARRTFSQLLALYPERATDVISFYIDQAHRPDLAMSIAPSDYRYQLQLMNHQTDPALRKASAARVEQILKVLCTARQADGDQLVAYAQLEAARGAGDAAVGLYRRALQTDYSRVDWHLELAHLLLRLGRRDEASAEAAVCIHLQPSCAPARDIINAVSGTRERT